jgi:putative ABC transport system permease protein
MTEMLRDIHLALRRFRFKPAHTIIMILILGMGIGATTAVFSVVDQTVLRPAPFSHADRIVDVIDWDRVHGGGGNSLTPGKIAGWQAQPSLFEAFEAYAPRQFDVTGDSEPERIRGLLVSIGLFNMLGVQPRLGRAFVRSDGIPGAERVVVISEALWQRRLGGREDVLGTTLALNDEPYTIIGVMPRRFRLTGEKERVWLPYDVQSNLADTSVQGFFGIARLAASVTRGSEQRLADSIADRLQEQVPLSRTWGLRLERKKVADVDKTTRTALFVLLAAVGFVLLITCANTANLFLSQIAIRQREMAIRTAIGASRWRLIREMLTESVLFAVCGGAVGVLLATWGVDAIVAAAPADLTFRATSPIEIDTRILVVTAGMTILTGVVFGLLPALRGSRPNLDVILRGTSGSGGSGSFSRFAGALIVAEVAFSLILLVGAALMIRTFANLGAVEPGFEPEGLVAVQISLPTDKYASSAARAAFIDSLSERLLAIPGVSDYAITEGVPPSGGATHFGAPEAEGSTVPVLGQQLTLPGNLVTPDYFRTLRIPIVAGRSFTAADTPESLIVTKALADRYWPDGTAVGRRFRPYNRMPWQTIVGVVANVDAWVFDKPTPFHIYSPWPAPTDSGSAGNAPRRRGYSARTIVVRAENPTAVIPAIKAAVWSIDRNQPIDKVALVDDVYADTFGRQRFVLQLMTAFGAVAVLLTIVGLFGVLSEIVVRKTREIGIRMALGARQADVLRLVLLRGLALAVAGTALGLVGAFALTRFLEALLFQVHPIDPLSFAVVTIVMIAIALLACWLPARRATRVGPADALRVE